VAKKLQLLLRDSEFREIRRTARSQGMSVAEWVRQALDLARLDETRSDVDKKIAIIAPQRGTIIPSKKSTIC
jgi:hypothetical protein